MKHFGMKEFQYVEGGGTLAPCISDQFNNWSDDNDDVTVLQITSHMGNNSDGYLVETLFVLYEFEVSEKININPIPEDAK